VVLSSDSDLKEPVALVLVLPAIAAAWLLAVAVAPSQAAEASTNWQISGPSLAGASCRHFAAGRVVGAGFGGLVGLRAEVCWNGRQAFLFGDPAAPPPPGVIPAELGGMPPIPDLTACGVDNQDDFATVSGTRCTATTDPDGTLHYSVHARVAPVPFGIAARDVALTLVVTRDGRVLEAP
jgi:hypothetical protein